MTFSTSLESGSLKKASKSVNDEQISIGNNLVGTFFSIELMKHVLEASTDEVIGRHNFVGCLDP